MSEAPKYVLDSEGGYEEIEKRVPEPAMIRAAVVAVLSLVGVVVGHEIAVPWLDSVLNIYSVVAPLALGWFIRQKVTPVASGKHTKL